MKQTICDKCGKVVDDEDLVAVMVNTIPSIDPVTNAMTPGIAMPSKDFHTACWEQMNEPA